MSERRTLLIELGCEELPAAQIQTMVNALGRGLFDQLVAHLLVEPDQHISLLATPRRLAVVIDGVLGEQPSQTIERRGPSVDAAFNDQGEPTPAALGFAKSVGLSIASLDRLKTDQGEWLTATIQQPGASLSQVVNEALQSLTQQMASAKSMRWRTGDERFVRPVRWLLAMHGQDVVPIELFGLHADNITWGHRIHNHGPWALGSASDYNDTLLRSHVVPSIEERKDRIKTQVSSLATQHGFALDQASFNDLVEENANLSEWPVAVFGSFDPRFLNVPEPALISAMQHHQKCFPLREDDSQSLAPHFVAIANIESTDEAAMRAGFERVIRPRLADAEFFWEQDRQTPLFDRAKDLDAVLFQKDLGSVAQKTQRMMQAAKAYGQLLSLDVAAIEQAATGAKCDLTTEMVGEFPELQGVMGYHYAIDSGVSKDIATAIEEHYWPKHAGAPLPSTPLGAVVALADRADSLMGIFGIGLKPKGSKDPFALRRAALGLVRILEQYPSLDLQATLECAAQPLAEQLLWDKDQKEKTIDEVSAFCLDRARSYASDQGISTATLNAVMAIRVSSVSDLMHRAQAVEALVSHQDIEKLIAANKRLANLLGKAEQTIPSIVDQDKLVDAEEKTLFDVWSVKKDHVQEAVSARDYDAALKHLIELADPLDLFFEKVMVMSEDPSIRDNRLGLLNQMRKAFLGIADLALLGR